MQSLIKPIGIVKQGLHGSCGNLFSINGELITRQRLADTPEQGDRQKHYQSHGLSISSASLRSQIEFNALEQGAKYRGRGPGKGKKAKKPTTPLFIYLFEKRK